MWAVVANCKVASFAKLNEMILLRSKRSQLVAGDPRSRRPLELLDQASSAEGNLFCSMENREREGGLDRIPADQVMNMPDIWGTEESEVRRQEMTRDRWVQVMRLVKSINKPA